VNCFFRTAGTGPVSRLGAIGLLAVNAGWGNIYSRVLLRKAPRQRSGNMFGGKLMVFMIIYGPGKFALEYYSIGHDSDSRTRSLRPAGRARANTKGGGDKRSGGFAYGTVAGANTDAITDFDGE